VRTESGDPLQLLCLLFSLSITAGRGQRWRTWTAKRTRQGEIFLSSPSTTTSDVMHRHDELCAGRKIWGILSLPVPPFRARAFPTLQLIDYGHVRKDKRTYSPDSYMGFFLGQKYILTYSLRKSWCSSFEVKMWSKSLWSNSVNICGNFNPQEF
jgi:hypothetical protein